MKRVKIILMIIFSIFILTGCNLKKFEYTGDEFYYQLSDVDSSVINQEGATIYVKDDQGFVEINTNTKDFKVYDKGNHKIEKKTKNYDYYFINSINVNNVTFGTSNPVKVVDKKYGELELNLNGSFDYKITDIENYISSFVKNGLDNFLTIDKYAESKIIDVIVQELAKEDVDYLNVHESNEVIVQNTIDALKLEGITCNRLVFDNIKLTNKSLDYMLAVQANENLLKTVIQNTTWIASDKSEMIFNENRFNWYLNQNNYNDNFQYGSFEFYSGDIAIEYMINDLKSFGITRDELDSLFQSNDKFNSSNFVVFNITLEGYTIDGVTSTVNKPIYWYGFLFDNNQTLQVVNMITAKYYNFSKKSA